MATYQDLFGTTSISATSATFNTASFTGTVDFETANVVNFPVDGITIDFVDNGSGRNVLTVMESLPVTEIVLHNPGASTTTTINNIDPDVDTVVEVPNPGPGITSTLFILKDTVTDQTINSGLVLNGNIQLNSLSANNLVCTDGSSNLVSKSLNGTANQIIVTNNAGNYTLSLPQDISTTSNVTFNSVSSVSASIPTITTSTINPVGLDVTINGIVQTANIDNSGTIDTTDVIADGEIKTNTIVPYSGTAISVGGTGSTTTVNNLTVNGTLSGINNLDLSGNLSVNNITPHSGTGVSIAASSGQTAYMNDVSVGNKVSCYGLDGLYVDVNAEVNGTLYANIIEPGNGQGKVFYTAFSGGTIYNSGTVQTTNLSVYPGDLLNTTITVTDHMNFSSNKNLTVSGSGVITSPRFTCPTAIADRKIVLWQGAGIDNDYQYYGMGVQNNILVYNVDTTTSDHVFYAGTSTTTKNELLRIKGTGGISKTASNLDIATSGSGAIRLISADTTSGVRMYPQSQNNFSLSVGRSSALSDAEIGIANASAAFVTNSSAGDAIVRLNNASNKLHFRVGSGSGASQLYIDGSDSNLVISNGIRFGVGNPAFNTYTGLTSFSPSIGDGVNNFNLTTAYGRYNRFSDMVYVNIWLIWNSKGAAAAGSTARISLPITPGMSRYPAHIGYASGVSFTGSTLVATGGPSPNAYLTLIGISTAGVATPVAVSQYAASGELQVSMWYSLSS